MNSLHTVSLDKNLIRKYREEMDQEGKLSQALIDHFFDCNLFKLFVDQRLNGEMLSLPAALKVFREAAAADGNVGWIAAIGAGGGMFSPAMPEQTAKELYSPSHSVVAGSGFPGGIAKRVPGGYQISGEWKYCSGSLYASMFTANCVIEGTDTIRSMVLMPDQVEVIRDWHAFGLRATGSHSMKIVEAFIPEERTFSIFEHQNHFIGDVHSFPFVPFSVASFTAVCLGIADHFFEEARQLIETRWSHPDEQQAMYEKLGGYEKSFSEVAHSFEQWTDEIWEQHLNGDPLDEQEIESFIQTARTAVATTRDSVNKAIRLYGMDAVTFTSPLNQIWRDLMTASQHTFLLPTLD